MASLPPAGRWRRCCWRGAVSSSPNTPTNCPNVTTSSRCKPKRTPRPTPPSGASPTFTKAVEQLGSADAAVRLGGLYALERVAQNNSAQRQTIVNVLCAYLRMPYIPPPPPSTASAASGPDTGLALLHIQAPAGERDPRQEWQVRLTAQRILTAHPTLPPGVTPMQLTRTVADRQGFWSDIDLDLTGATLIDWDLQGGHVHHAVFEGATFLGTAWFDETTFSGAALFSGATFTGDARFPRAVFTGGASFSGATFSGAAQFDGAVVDRDRAGTWPPGWQMVPSSDGRYGRLIQG